MDHHPYRYKGRFYNHAQDSITARFWRMLKTSCEMRAHMKACGGKKKLLDEADMISPAWLVPFTSSPSRHDQPVITWLGHATMLIQIGSFTLLCDPVFDEISRLVPRTMKFPWSIDELPAPDVIVISHNHRDHLDVASLRKLVQFQPSVYVPQGDARLLKKIGYTNVTEMTWWQDVSVAKNEEMLKISFLPASHWTGRGPFDLNTSLWGSWLFTYQGKTIYFAGDTAFDTHFEAIRHHVGSLDIALMPIGPVEPHGLIADAHLDPREAVEAFLALDAT
ncbi:MAG: MBL fold metallo-hydrolase, partial [Candidatus Babeliales bacterium]